MSVLNLYWVEVRDANKHPTICRSAACNKELSGSKQNSDKVTYLGYNKILGYMNKINGMGSNNCKILGGEKLKFVKLATPGPSQC